MGVTTDNEKKEFTYGRFEVLTVVKMIMMFFWVVTPFGLISRYQHFRGTYCPPSSQPRRPTPSKTSLN
jgi:hypothetical protein